MTNIISTFRKSWIAKIALAYFILISIWWITIYLRNLQEGRENDLFTLIYPWMSLLGGISGVVIAKKWGGIKSAFGKSISLLSFGLLAQSFGQLAYSYYIYIKGVEVPYPSLGDLGYFGSIIFYIFGVIFLGKVLGANISFKTIFGKIISIVIPLCLLAISYLVFLRGYEFDFSKPFTIFLDFGYPFGQAIYVSLAISIYLLSRKIVGGIMKWPTFFLLFALAVQYFCDYIFLYQVNKEQWYVGGINDYMYFFSYFLMTIGLIQLGFIFNRIKNTK